jgi:thioesterase domain-containing protein
METRTRFGNDAIDGSAYIDMKGKNLMPDTPERLEVKHALLEKYLRDRSRTTTAPHVISQCAEAEVADQRESVIPIQTGGSRLPFFFLHGDWVRGAYWCFPLARDLGADQPFYALEPYSFDGLPVSPPMETIAAAHLKSMRTIQPEGPYLLGGFCNGALLAYEMARQLHAEGQKLDLLVLMDPMGLIYPIKHRVAHVVITWLGKVTRLSQEKQLHVYIFLRHVYNYLRYRHYRRSKDARPWRVDEQIELERRRSKGRFALPRHASIFPPVEALHQDYSAIYDWAAICYAPPGLYPDKIIFFWDSEEPWRRKGWRKAAETNEIEVHVIPGTQMESRTEYLHVLAEHLSACLSKVQATASST